MIAIFQEWNAAIIHSKLAGESGWTAINYSFEFTIP